MYKNYLRMAGGVVWCAAAGWDLCSKVTGRKLSHQIGRTAT